jgi:Concanavalin A-like lectin/glucanases superfamily
VTRQVADTENNDTGLVVGGVTYQQPGPSTGTYAEETNSSAAGTNLIETTNIYADPSTYSVAGWFEMPSIASGGTLMEFASVQQGTPQSYDRIVFVNDTGHLVFGVNNAGVGEEQTATTAIVANTWYYMLISFASGGAVSGYLNGTRVFTSSAAAYDAPDVYSGYWRIGDGYYSTATWAGTPTDDYFDGSLAGFTYYASTALSAANDTTLYDAGNFAAYATGLAAVGTPTAYWAMQETGTTGYTTSGTPSAFVPDQSGNGNTGTVVGGVTLANNVSPISGGESYAFNGTTGNIETTTKETNPQVFTESAWFELPVGDSGPIMGFSDVQGTTGLADYDRAIWVDSTGHLVAGVWPNSTVEEIISTGTYNNAAWHEVTVTIGPAGFLMYADGALVASNTAITTVQTYNGYWHIGWGGDEISGWADPPSVIFFPGDIAGVAVYSTQLSAAASIALDNGTTYDAQVFNNSVTYFWNWFTPSVCGFITLATTVTASGACVLPISGCAVPQSLAALVGLRSAAIALTTSGATATTGLTQSVTALSGTPPFEIGLVGFGQQSFYGQYGASLWLVALEHPYSTVLT